MLIQIDNEVREATLEDFARYQAMQEPYTTQAQQAAQTAAATQAAIAHAKSLGFTDEMIAVMYPNLAP